MLGEQKTKLSSDTNFILKIYTGWIYFFSPTRADFTNPSTSKSYLLSSSKFSAHTHTHTHTARLSAASSSSARFSSSYLCTTTRGFRRNARPERGAPWPAWWLKGCRRRPSEEEWCWTDGGAKPGGESERSCSPSRCASRGHCWGSSWGSSPWHGKQVRGHVRDGVPGSAVSQNSHVCVLWRRGEAFMWSLWRAVTTGCLGGKNAVRET